MSDTDRAVEAGLPCQRIDPMTGGACKMQPDHGAHGPYGSHAYTAKDRRVTDRRASSRPAAPDSLDVAWKAVEAAIEERPGWAGPVVQRGSILNVGGQYSAMAWEWVKGLASEVRGAGDTPAAALTELAARLAALPSVSGVRSDG